MKFGSSRGSLIGRANPRIAPWRAAACNRQSWARRAAAMPRSHAEIFAALLQNLYHDLLDLGIPDSMAVLVRRLTTPDDAAAPAVTKIAIIADADPAPRARASALFRESGLRAVECADSEELIGAVERHGADVALVFGDGRLAGYDQWVHLADRIATLAPRARIVVTTQAGARLDALPAGIVQLAKPWHGLDVLIEGSRAAGHSPES